MPWSRRFVPMPNCLASFQRSVWDILTLASLSIPNPSLFSVSDMASSSTYLTSSVCCFLFLLRSQKNTATPISASPPIAPPAIAPMFVSLFSSLDTPPGLTSSSSTTMHTFFPHSVQLGRVSWHDKPFAQLQGSGVGHFVMSMQSLSRREKMEGIAKWH